MADRHSPFWSLKGRFRRLFRQKKTSVPVSNPPAPDDAGSESPSVFVNRVREVDLLRSIVERRTPQLVIVLGAPGIGKSWLLRFFLSQCQSRGEQIRLIEVSSCRTALDLLLQVQTSLSRVGVETREAEALMRRYQDRYSDIASRLGSSLTSRLAQGHARVVGALSPDVQEELSLLIRSIMSADDYELVTHPESLLSLALKRDLSRAGEASPPVVIMDEYVTFAGHGPIIEDLMIEMARKCILVVGSTTLPDQLWRDKPSNSSLISLPSLSPDDTRECITSYAGAYSQNVSEEDVSRISAFSQGLPLAVRWAVELLARSSDTDFSSVAQEALERISDSLLSDTPREIRTLVEVCSIPRWVNEDLLGVLPIEMAPGQAYALLRQLSLFSEVPQGLALQPQVREFASRTIRRRAPRLWASVHEICRDYHLSMTDEYKSWGREAGILRRDSLLELCYHELARSLESAFPVIVESCEFVLQRAELETAAAIVAEARCWPFEEYERASLDYISGEISFRRGDWNHAVELLSAATASPVREHRLFPNAAMTLGRIRYAQGRFQESGRLLEDALEAITEDTSPLRGYTMEQLAKVNRMLGRLGRAIALHQGAIAQSRSAGADYSLASNMGSYGTTLILAGDFQAGVDNLRESIQRSRRGGFLQFVCTGSRSRAVGLQLQGRLTQARAHAEEAERIASELGDQYNLGFARYVLAGVQSEIERSAMLPGKDLWKSALALLSRVGAPSDEANARISRAHWLMSYDSDHENARRDLSRARLLLEKTDFLFGRANLAIAEAAWLRLTNDREAGLAKVAEALELADSVGAAYLVASAQSERLYNLYAGRSQEETEGDAEEAERQIDQALSVAINSGYWRLAADLALLRLDVLSPRLDAGGVIASASSALGAAASHNGLCLAECAERVRDLLIATDREALIPEVRRTWRERASDDVFGGDRELRLREQMPGIRWRSVTEILEGS